MSTKKNPLAALNKKLDAGKTPKKLSKKERKALVEEYCPDVYKTFLLKSGGTVKELLKAFQDAAEKAQAMEETLVVKTSSAHLNIDFNDARIVVEGCEKMSDDKLIAAYAKDRKAQLKAAKEGELTDKEAAIRTIASLKKTYGL